MTKIDGGLRQIFRDHLKFFDFQSIESHATGKGTPDTNYCKDGFEGWIEYKKTEANKVKSLKPEQVAWTERRLRHGGRVWIAIRERILAGPRRGAERDVLWMIRGRGIRALYIGGLIGVPIEDRAGSFPGGPRNWDWQAISAILTSK